MTSARAVYAAIGSFGWRHRRLLAALLAGLLAILVLKLTGVVTIDWFPALHTYGFSVGTNTHYCSVELVGWHPAAGCEVAS